MNNESITIKYFEDYLNPLNNIIQKELDYNYGTPVISSISVNYPIDPRMVIFVRVQKDNIKDFSSPIEEVLEALSKEIPIEEWKKLPDDLTDNLDHYLYGIPMA